MLPSVVPMSLDSEDPKIGCLSSDTKCGLGVCISGDVLAVWTVDSKHDKPSLSPPEQL